MNRLVFNTAFTLGLLAVAWVAWSFVGGSALPLAMTALIAGVYLLGGLELHRFRQASAGLAQALAELPETLTELSPWLAHVPASLRQPVRLRIEGERVGLPGPTLTPYLVGLLVMLGMLGTFLGMVLTFKGAVFALEGSTDLPAIRAALAAPIKGLGLSFGTSVAGVASSAMLGLVSALCRRERLAISRELDTRIASSLRPCSLAYQRQATFQAIQSQSEALPAVAERLHTLMDGLERRSQQLQEQLLGQQAQFHRDAASVYTDLAQDLGRTLADSLRASTQAATDSLTPVVRGAMEALSAESALAHRRMSDSTRTQLDDVANRFGKTAEALGVGWQAAQASQIQAHRQLVEDLARHDTERLSAWTRQLDAQAQALHQAWQHCNAQNQAQHEAVCTRIDQAAQQIAEHSGHQTRQMLNEMSALLRQAEALVAARTEAEARWQSEQGQRMDALTAIWRSELAALRDEEARRGEAASARLGSLQGAFADHLDALRERNAHHMTEQAKADELRLHAWTAQLQNLGETLCEAWQCAGLQTLAEQRAVCLALEKTASEITERVSAQATRQLDDITRLLDQSEALVRSRLESENIWVAQQGQRMDQLAGVWRQELAALRADEAQRGEAAVTRLGDLQAALAAQLAKLGSALEAPMTRLMQTAADVPQAAAQVITELRQEMVRLSERDNQALAERQTLMGQLHTLMQAVQEGSSQQQAAIAQWSEAARRMLDEAGARHAETLSDQARQASEAAAQVAGSAIDLASLGEAFQQGMHGFQASNERLVESLARIDSALQHSIARSDEQLAYYVAQAREVIDLSISAQQGIVEDLRRLHAAQAGRGEGSTG